MKIGILQTGRSPDETQEKHGDYGAFFMNYLGGRGFEFENYPVLDGVFPTSPKDADGWLITGSRFGVYEGHAWIAPLEDFLRETYALGTPIVGICFGHQILAQALGGKIEKFEGGWSVGPAKYTSERFGDQNIIAWHKDQVVKRPDEATVVGSSAFCENAILVYGNKALTIQPHPEFTGEFLTALLQTRGKALPDDIRENAAKRAGEDLTSASFADHIEKFFKADRP
ncbi:type 1 glutamine amidotransferase [Falsihalocynthiibacter arcticus]|uniref:Glutamine amidotransferase n=1 Tax=Falsihalocynthiibacter arcticus TaxID=1579316 RepID=A0A126V1W8_9RHOB|nr:type 1 glutamine amidotransferase [Falsihalocynthiibacter arcticus]AML52177.1 glutamine amidotransferase [Falsihalocynthiibacter arcticus]